MGGVCLGRGRGSFVQGRAGAVGSGVLAVVVIQVVQVAQTVVELGRGMGVHGYLRGGFMAVWGRLMQTNKSIVGSRVQI